MQAFTCHRIFDVQIRPRLARRYISKRMAFRGWFRGTCQYAVATIDTYLRYFQRSYSTRYAPTCPRNHLNRMPNLLFPLHTILPSLSLSFYLRIRPFPLHPTLFHIYSVKPLHLIGSREIKFGLFKNEII